MAKSHSALREVVWYMAIEQFVTNSMECVLITVQHSVTDHLKFVIDRKIVKFDRVSRVS